MSTGSMKRSTSQANPTAMTSKVQATRDPFASLREEMNDLVTRFWGGNQMQFGNVLTPALDVSETDNVYDLRLDLPGMKPENFDIQVQGNVVRISGRREEEHEVKEATYHCIERQKGNFSRTVTLGCDVNEDEVAAEYIDGVLSVKLPKCEQARSKKITVRS